MPYGRGADGVGDPYSRVRSHGQYIHTSHVVDTHCNTTIYPVSYMLGKHYTPFQSSIDCRFKQ